MEKNLGLIISSVLLIVAAISVLLFPSKEADSNAFLGFIVFTIIGAVIVYFAAKAIDRSRGGSAAPTAVFLLASPNVETGAVAPATENTRARANPGLGSAAFLVILAGIIYYLFFFSPGFSDAEIERTQKSMREHFGKLDKVTIESIDLMRSREDSGRLLGMVKLKLGDIPLTKTCSATLSEKRAVFWRCE